ncbi:cytidine deaminase-like [Coccinella septempunctata]|uniref:cytidine deaminase-like n=1 Tax=Coccinella septempunctata TaxID=41139 RepID=UPI001D07B768|nr:cytidine deaminase-like [Coccinella septempunctata]
MATNKDHKICRIQKLGNLGSDIQNLLREAVEARLTSYSPYSKFQVGAAVLAEDGTIYKGCNIENASFPVGQCAEKTAFGTAICSGRRKFKAVAVVASQEKGFTTPCGGCRQFMSEFGEVDLYISKPELNEVLVTTLGNILPLQFEVCEDYSF